MHRRCYAAVIIRQSLAPSNLRFGDNLDGGFVLSSSHPNYHYFCYRRASLALATVGLWPLRSSGGVLCIPGYSWVYFTYYAHKPTTANIHCTSIPPLPPSTYIVQEISYPTSTLDIDHRAKLCCSRTAFGLYQKFTKSLPVFYHWRGIIRTIKCTIDIVHRVHRGRVNLLFNS